MTTDEKIERLMCEAGRAGDDFVAGLCRTALGRRPDAGADEVARCRALCEVMADASEMDQLREDNKHLREQITKVRHDRDRAIALIDELEADLGRVKAENTRLRVRLERLARGEVRCLRFACAVARLVRARTALCRLVCRLPVGNGM